MIGIPISPYRNSEPSLGSHCGVLKSEPDEREVPTQPRRFPAVPTSESGLPTTLSDLHEQFVGQRRLLDARSNEGDGDEFSDSGTLQLQISKLNATRLLAC